ncbi:hypothetical protein PSTT_15547 [Puccinia striiformis]|uniref:Uncharacterized protein n=1 Tax=Puccinia striiformis TaxID=27350 RepID=A0A2S4UHH5_9BASI|nr:hypothetical protein PSTT_15547 [Puccinia striiformis]
MSSEGQLNMSGIEARQPDANSATNQNSNMIKLVRLVKLLAENVTRAAVSTFIEGCEIFEGLSEEEKELLYAAVGLTPPNPDLAAENLATHSLCISRMVHFTLNSLDRQFWEDDDQFVRMAILNCTPARDEPAALEASEATARITNNPEEARLKHFQKIRLAEEVITNSRRKIQEAQETIAAERLAEGAIIEEIIRDNQMENFGDAVPRPDSEPNTDPTST